MALRLPSANHFAARRSLRAAIGYYTRWIDRSKAFVLGEKPGLLRHLGSVDKRVWKQYQTHLRRATPLERAEFYAREMKERRAKSHQALSLLLGEPRNRVGRSMKLLALPDPIKDFLRQHREPEHLRYFSENRLQELVRIGDPRAIWRRFQEMVKEAKQQAGIWKPKPK
jgi:hypothetical protein